MIAPAPIAAVASAVAGVPVQVFCRPSSTMAGEEGYVVFRDAVPDHVIYLDAGVCQRLSHPLDGFDALDYVVLAHEAAHISLASMDECVVEQSALQNVWQTIRRFKLPAWLARWALANAPIADATRLGPAYHVDSVTGACPA